MAPGAAPPFPPPGFLGASSCWRIYSSSPPVLHALWCCVAHPPAQPRLQGRADGRVAPINTLGASSTRPCSLGLWSRQSPVCTPHMCVSRCGRHCPLQPLNTRPPCCAQSITCAGAGAAAAGGPRAPALQRLCVLARPHAAQPHRQGRGVVRQGEQGGFRRALGRGRGRFEGALGAWRFWLQHPAATRLLPRAAHCDGMCVCKQPSCTRAPLLLQPLRPVSRARTRVCVMVRRSSLRG